MNDMQRTAPVPSKTAQRRKLAPAGSPAARVDWPKVLNEACRIIERDAPRLDAPWRSASAWDGRNCSGNSRGASESVPRPTRRHLLCIVSRGERAWAERRSMRCSMPVSARTRPPTPPPRRRWARRRDAFAAHSTSAGGWACPILDGCSWERRRAAFVGLAFGEAPGAMLEELRAAFPKATLYNDESRLYGWFEKVRGFVLLPREALDLPLDIQGTAFQSRVWRALRQIPLGDTEGYGELALRLGQPGAARAVASACARNPAALLIPCHRVIAADGKPAGYRWGADRKRQLLQREASVRGESEASRTQSRARNQPLMLSRSR